MKEGGDRTFVIVDAAMNDLVRPTLYDAYHRIGPVRETERRGDRLRHRRADLRERRFLRPRAASLPRPAAGRSSRDLLRRRLRRGAGRHLQFAAARAGSAGQRRPISPSVRRRPTYDELIGLDRLPDWLGLSSRSSAVTRLCLAMLVTCDTCMMQLHDAQSASVNADPKLDRLERAIGRARLALASERLWPPLAPILSVARRLCRPLLARLLAARRRLAAPRHARAARPRAALGA